jgi:hypothetical protein
MVKNFSNKDPKSRGNKMKHRRTGLYHTKKFLHGKGNTHQGEGRQRIQKKPNIANDTYHLRRF